MKLHTTLVIEHGLDGRTDRNVTGNVAKVFDGDAVEQVLLLGDLRHTFSKKFDRGDLSVESLELVLWQSHWYRASRQAMQRAADMLILAAANEIKIPGSSKLSRECEGLAKVLDLFVNAKPADHPIGDALLRGEPIPASDGVRRLESELSALRVDGIRPTALLTSEESQALAEQIRSTADAVEAVGTELGGNEARAVDDAGSTMGADESPFRLYQFAHEMHELLKRINVKVGGVHAVLSHGMEPSPTMQCECDQAISDIWSLLARIDGRNPLDTDVEGRDARQAMIDASEHYRVVLDRSEREEALRQRIEQSMTCEILEADLFASIVKLQVRQPLEGISNGLWKLVRYTPSAYSFGGAA